MEDEQQTQPNAVIAFFQWFFRVLWEVWGEPILMGLRLYEPKDRTYGRAKIPFSKMEKRLHDNPDVTVSFHKTMMPNNKDFVWYQVWEDKAAQRATGRKADMIFCHGTGVHSGTLASHSRRYLDAGFRLIVPDLPSHGYSTGVHVYQRHGIGYTAGVRQVIHDVDRRDEEESGVRREKKDKRVRFLLGLSFGGLVALIYPLHFPGSRRDDTTDMDEIPIDGIIGVGPLIDYARDNIKIGSLVRVLALFLDLFNLTRLELFVPHKKVLDKDPKVYKTLVDQDMRSHRGAFRIGHLLCIRDMIGELQDNAHKFTHPLYVQQGLQDRVVVVADVISWVRRCNSEDLKLSVYPVCQHVIYRKAKTEEEDRAGRIAVLEDNVAWMSERSPGQGHINRAMSFSSDIGGEVSPAMTRSASFSVSGAVTPTDNNGPEPGLVASTLHSLSERIDSAIESAAVASAIPDATAGLTHRGLKITAPDAPVVSAATAAHIDRHSPEWIEQHIYRPNWTLSEELRPYDIPM
ncbi:hypothetical protein MCUN1_003830 [Malassezia cuniculi]|uniref:Serine aminopeptidase S33 domain-containing protein n=1 Tax=Malassezia cuniculi TaxID=948313 RepID=A0AAF0F2B7_9BASI|nr:hypothetical protein MCUN1_003830 [Malassezia cuniculi]